MRFVLDESRPAAYTNYLAAERALAEGRVRLDNLPVHARLDVTTRCNLRCIQCVGIQARLAERDMDPEVLERIASEVLPTAAAVQYADGGEPFLYKQHPRTLELLSQHRHPYSRIFTNATLLDEALCRRLIECGLKDLAVSLDGATAPTFEGIRRGASFDRVVENLTRLRDLKRKLGSRLPVVTVHVVAMRDNLAELASIVRLAKELAAEEVIVYALNCYTPEMHAQSTASVPEETRRRLAEAIEVGMELGLPVRSPDLPTPPVPQRERVDERFYKGRLKVDRPAKSLPAGRQASFAVEVRNRSPFTWYSSLSPSAESNVAASYHVYAADGSLSRWEGERTPLPRHLRPGERAAFDVAVNLPERGGKLTLGFDLVNEGARWFGLEQRVRIMVSEAAAGHPLRGEVPVEATPTETQRCTHPWKYVALKVNGDVFPCRFLSLSMGNLRERSFAEIWNSDGYLHLRESILDGSYSLCRGASCPFACAPPGMFRSRVELSGPPPCGVPPGGIARVRLAITNLGTVSWNARPVGHDPTYYALSCSLFNEDGSLRPSRLEHDSLPHDVPPGSRVELDVEVPAPQRAGRDLIGFEMMKRHVFTFALHGNAVCQVPLPVEARTAPA